MCCYHIQLDVFLGETWSTRLTSYYMELAKTNTYKNISSYAQYMTLQKYFSHPSLVIYFLANPSIETETRIANRWGNF